MNLRKQLSRDHREMVNGICESLLCGVHEEVRKVNRDLGAIVADEGQVTEAEQFPEFTQNLREKISGMRRLLERARIVLEEVSSNGV